MSTPLPFIRPCSPVTAKGVPAGPDWLHEPKLDGYRLQVVKEGRQVRLYSRNGHEWTFRLSALAEALKGIPGQSVVLDAELVYPDAEGVPDFDGLQGAMTRSHELVVYVFDILHRDGQDLRSLPLSERRERLERLLSRSKVPCLHMVHAFDDGKALLETAERLELEGIVSKRRSAHYRSGKCLNWQKVKTASWRAANWERSRKFERA